MVRCASKTHGIDISDSSASAVDDDVPQSIDEVGRKSKMNGTKRGSGRCRVSLRRKPIEYARTFYLSHDVEEEEHPEFTMAPLFTNCDYPPEDFDMTGFNDPCPDPHIPKNWPFPSICYCNSWKWLRQSCAKRIEEPRNRWYLQRSESVSPMRSMVFSQACRPDWLCVHFSICNIGITNIIPRRKVSQRTPQKLNGDGVAKGSSKTGSTKAPLRLQRSDRAVKEKWKLILQRMPITLMHWKHSCIQKMPPNTRGSTNINHDPRLHDPISCYKVKNLNLIDVEFDLKNL